MQIILRSPFRYQHVIITLGVNALTCRIFVLFFFFFFLLNREVSLCLRRIMNALSCVIPNVHMAIALIRDTIQFHHLSCTYRNCLLCVSVRKISNDRNWRSRANSCVKFLVRYKYYLHS